MEYTPSDVLTVPLGSQRDLEICEGKRRTVMHATTQTASSSANYAPTTGVGVAQSRVRARLQSIGGLDTAASLGVESGIFHTATRGRVTNVGDGTHGVT